MSTTRTLLSILLAAIAASPLLAQRKDLGPDTAITADSRDPRMLALFIPATDLFTPDGELRKEPFLVNGEDRGGQQRFMNLVRKAQRRAAQNPSDPCLPYQNPVDRFAPSASHTTGQYRAVDTSESWQKQIERMQVTVEAQVVSVTPGLSPSSLTPTSLVTIRVLKPLRGENVRTTDLITYLTKSGFLQVNGASVCVSDPGEQIPVVGQRLIVSGSIQPQRTHLHLQNRPKLHVYQINQDGTVTVTNPNGSLEPVALGHLESVVRALPPPAGPWEVAR
jgi:hypothetical protein